LKILIEQNLAYLIGMIAFHAPIILSLIAAGNTIEAISDRDSAQWGAMQKMQNTSARRLLRPRFIAGLFMAGHYCNKLHL